MKGESVFSLSWLKEVFRVPKVASRKAAGGSKSARDWIVLGKVYRANTKSEARGLAKAALGLRRLPVGVVVKVA